MLILWFKNRGSSKILDFINICNEMSIAINEPNLKIIPSYLRFINQ